MVRISEDEAKRLGLVSPKSNKPKRKKYNNTPCTYQGLKFDSIKERDYYLILLDKQKRGEIYDLKRQEAITIQPAFTDSRGKRQRPIVYKADFTYKEIVYEGAYIKHYIDVKGGNATKTAVYRLKKKLLAYKGYYIEEV